MLKISNTVTIPERDITFMAIRAQGAGGQNVNKVSSAVHLRFDVMASSLPIFYKERLLAIKDQRINKAGIIIIKAQRYRSQEQNRADALLRLQQLIHSVQYVAKKRKPTKPSTRAKQKRMDHKTQRGRLKESRRKVTH